MKHIGDITKINGAAVPPVNIITGGSPCQDLSVAGKRAGLAGERSGLFMEQIRIIKEMREHDRAEQSRRASAGSSGPNIAIRLRPRYMVWENVPGAFSSNNGEDFRAVLEETAKIAKSDVFIPRPKSGRWTHAGAILGRGDDGTPFSIAWRLHDAQYWGVPQRRKRIALVADFGGWTATKILFDSESLPGDLEPSGTQRERASRDPKDGTGEPGEGADERDGLSFQERAGKPGGAKGILIQRGHTGAISTLQLNKVLAPESIGLNRERCGAVTATEIVPTIQAAAGESGNNQQMVCTPERDPHQEPQGVDCYKLTTTGSIGRTMATASGGLNEHIPCVVDKDPHPVAFEPSIASRCGGHIYENGIAGTVRANAGDNQQAIVYGISAYESNAMKSANPHSGIYEADTARTLDLNGGTPACNQGGMAIVAADIYNGKTTGEIATTLTTGSWSAGHSGPTAVSIEGNEKHAIAFTTEITPKTDENGKDFSLRSRDYKDAQSICVEEPTILGSNQNHAIITNNGICNTLPSSMGQGGGYIPMITQEEKQ